jgi:PAS domain S-box-containing protein
MPEDVMRRLEQLSEPGAILDPADMVSILDGLPDAVIVINEEGIMRFVNEACELLFGYTRVALLGQPIEMLLPEGMRARHVEHRRRFFREPRTRPMGAGIERPLTGLHRNGAEMTLKINLSPRVTSQGVLAVATVRRPEDHATA